jgi:hypothetical protein
LPVTNGRPWQTRRRWICSGSPSCGSERTPVATIPSPALPSSPHARRDAPNECCGLPLGRGRRVRFAWLANADA